MILRRLTKHVKDQNWFAVALDFVIVVAGVYVGIALGNWNAGRAELRELAAFETSFRTERMQAYINAKEVFVTRACRRTQIDAIAAALREPGELWTGQPWPGALSNPDGLPTILRAAQRVWVSDQLDTARTRSFYRRIDRQREFMFMNINAEASLAENAQKTVLDMIAPLSPLAVSQTLGPSDRQTYQRLLSQLDAGLSAVERYARNIINIVELGLPGYSDPGFEGGTLTEGLNMTRESLQQFNDQIRDVYGECAEPIVISETLLPSPTEETAP